MRPLKQNRKGKNKYIRSTTNGNRNREKRIPRSKKIALYFEFIYIL